MLIIKNLWKKTFYKLKAVEVKENYNIKDFSILSLPKALLLPYRLHQHFNIAAQHFIGFKHVLNFID